MASVAPDSQESQVGIRRHRSFRKLPCCKDGSEQSGACQETKRALNTQKDIEHPGGRKSSWRPPGAAFEAIRTFRIRRLSYAGDIGKGFERPGGHLRSQESKQEPPGAKQAPGRQEGTKCRRHQRAWKEGWIVINNIFSEENA